jgi:cyclophilin family peptidyl-prolyl cis-trans isomerase
MLIPCSPRRIDRPFLSPALATSRTLTPRWGRSLLLGTLLVTMLGSSTTWAQQDDAASPADAAADTPTGPAVTAPPAVEAQPAPSAAAQAAKGAFDALQQQWVAIIEQISAAKQDRSVAGDAARAESQQRVLELRQQADALVGKIVDASLAVYQADADRFPEVNSTLLAIVQFYLVGDAQGDGGDQFEKALPPIQGLLAAGAGDEWPYLWTWGGVAAYCVNEFDLAGEYFDKAQAAGELSDTPPSRNPSDPRTRIWQLANQYQQQLPTIRQAWTKEAKIRAAEAQADDLPRVKLTTNRGEIVVELFENEAPQATANFLTLVKRGFYDGVVFHRVLPGFMAQGGDPTGSGSGGPGYNIRCECYQPDFRKHFRGTLSMAHAGRDTGGSQFFLTFVPTSFLDGRHTAFGRVIEGMEVAASLKRIDPQGGRSVEPDRILKAEVVRDRGHAYDFARLPGR